MSNLVSVRVESSKLQAALRAAPDVMHRHVDGAVLRGANEIAAEEKRLAPNSGGVESGLVGSINVFPHGSDGDIAYEVRPTADYAAFVVHGSGPAVGKPRYYPNPDNLLQHLMTNPRARGFARFKRSERGRLEQEMGLVRRAQAFAWWIYQHGTKPQDFITPAVANKRGACEVYIRQAVDRGLREVLGPDAVRYF